MVHIKRVRNDQTNMMVTDHKGRIMYMNTDLATALGYTPKQVSRGGPGACTGEPGHAEGAAQLRRAALQEQRRK